MEEELTAGVPLRPSPFPRPTKQPVPILRTLHTLVDSEHSERTIVRSESESRAWGWEGMKTDLGCRYLAWPSLTHHGLPQLALLDKLLSLLLSDPLGRLANPFRRELGRAGERRRTCFGRGEGWVGFEWVGHVELERGHRRQGVGCRVENDELSGSGSYDGHRRREREE